MRVVCQGWRHVDKYHKLLRGDISGLQPSSEDLRHRDEVYIDIDEDELVISSGVENLKINGNFSVEVRLTTREIINLARIALANEPFGDVVKALNGKR